MVRALLNRRCVFALLGLIAGGPSAFALPYYFEFGGNTASLTTPAPLFQATGKGSATSAGSTFTVPFTLGLHLQERQRGVLFAVALQSRYFSGQTGDGQSFTVFPTSPMLRVEFWRFVLGVGYTPYVWESITFKKASAIGSVLTLEAQFLFPITPEIDFGLQSSRETFSSSRYGNGPTVFEYGAFFRLNFGFSDAASSERRKFKGWRYPLGSPIR